MKKVLSIIILLSLIIGATFALAFSVAAEDETADGDVMVFSPGEEDAAANEDDYDELPAKDENYTRVQDLTYILIDDEIDALNAKLKEYRKDLKEDIVIAIVGQDFVDYYMQESYGRSASADPMLSLQTIADDIFDMYGYGVGEKNSGVLVLIRIDEPYHQHFWISDCGDILNLFGSDENIDAVYEPALEYIKSGDIAKAANVCADEAAKVIKNEKGFHPVKKILISLVIGFVIAAIVVFTMKGKLKSVRVKSEASDYVVPGSFVVNQSRDLFLYSHVTRTERPKNTSSGGSHTSSSGVSHGGGGR